jgi:hypothetical protein
MSFDEQPDGDIHGECAAEIDRLTSELERAYRCIVGLNNAVQPHKLVDAMLMYHSPTIAAAKRWVYEGELDGASYFEGEDVSVLQAALKLGEEV